jgi:hypothetical protein
MIKPIGCAETLHVDFVGLHFDIRLSGVTMTGVNSTLKKTPQPKCVSFRTSISGFFTSGVELNVAYARDRRLLEKPLAQRKWSTESSEQRMNPALSLTIEGFFAIAAKHIILYLLGRLRHLFAGKTHRMEIAGTEERIE